MRKLIFIFLVLLGIGIYAFYLYYTGAADDYVLWIMVISIYMFLLLHSFFNVIIKFKKNDIVTKVIPSDLSSVMSNAEEKAYEHEGKTSDSEDISKQSVMNGAEFADEHHKEKDKENYPEDKIQKDERIMNRKLDEMKAGNSLAFSLYLSKWKYDLSLHINVEDQTLYSEDAPPINEFIEKNELYLLATFDGLGGSGAKQYKLSNNSIRTGAAIGAKLAQEVTVDWFTNDLLKNFNSHLFTNDFHVELENILKERFRTEIEELHKNKLNRPKLEGTLVKFLPTTAALVFAIVNYDRSYSISSVWAGDSINFILSPDNGMQPITIDDFVESCDALARIRQGPVLSNVVQACIRNKDYKLRRFDFKIPANQKFILLSCSDGAFDYFSNPAEFELNLLKYMLAVDNPEAWKQNLTELFKRIAQDDVTMALRAFGFSSYEELKAAFEKRYAELNEMIAKVKREAIEEIKNKTQEALSDDNRAKRDAEASENDVSERHLANELTIDRSDIEDQSEEVADEILKKNDHAVMPEEKRETVDDASDKQMADEDNAEETEQMAKPESDNSDRFEKPKSESKKPLPDLDVNQRIWAEYKPGYEFFMQEIQRQLDN